MGKIIYVTGGARSGKSSFAEKMVLEQKKIKKIYVATAIAFDEEMKERVKKHKEQRGDGWVTLECFKNIDEKLKKYENESEGIILIDCLTNMVTNLMLEDFSVNWDEISQEKVNKIEKKIQIQINNLLNFIENSKINAVIVSNEVGMGIVPEYPLARYFRDIAGRMNQLVAKKSNECFLVISGISLKIK